MFKTNSEYLIVYFTKYFMGYLIRFYMVFTNLSDFLEHKQLHKAAIVTIKPPTTPIAR